MYLITVLNVNNLPMLESGQKLIHFFQIQPGWRNSSEKFDRDGQGMVPNSVNTGVSISGLVRLSRLPLHDSLTWRLSLSGRVSGHLYGYWYYFWGLSIGLTSQDTTTSTGLGISTRVWISKVPNPFFNELDEKILNIKENIFRLI